MRATASANVVLYIVDPIGGRAGPISWPLAPASANRRVSEDNWRKDSRAEFTGWTGGFAVTGTNDRAGQLDRIVEDVSAYYFIDYDSSDQKADGKYPGASRRGDQAGRQGAHAAGLRRTEEVTEASRGEY